MKCSNVFILALSTCLSTNAFANELHNAQICQRVETMEIHSHRGASDRPENMLSAFHRAVDQGADFVEMDLQFSKDNQVIVAHDVYLKNECLDKNGLPLSERTFFRNLTVDQIKEFDCGSRIKSGKPIPGEKISTLKEVLDSLRDRYTHKGYPLNFNIEIKYNPTQPEFYPSRELFIDELLRVLDQSHINVSRLMVQSFDVEILKVLRTRREDLRISPLLSDITNGLKIARDLKAELITPHISQVTPSILKRFHENRIKVVPWTINSNNEILKAIQMGVDGVITDHPDLFSCQNLVRIQGT